MLIFMATFMTLLSLVLLSLLTGFLIIHASKTEVTEYLHELYDGYNKTGQEKLTVIVDLINRKVGPFSFSLRNIFFNLLAKFVCQ